MKEKELLSNINARLGISELNEMQRRMAGLQLKGTVTLIAPTGSGKTLAFAIPLLKNLGPSDGKVRTVVMAPSRELVMQIFEVIRPIATGLKTVAFYGGHPMQEEVNSLSVTPDIIVATPGRLLDHIKRGNLDLSGVRTLVLDEYDKALELGFADEMKRVCKKLTSVSFVILTSATPLFELPDYLPKSTRSELVDFSASTSPRRQMQIVHVPSPSRDKLDTLIDLLRSLQDGRVIVFANHRESVERIHAALRKAGLPAGLYHGGLEQNERENAVELLNNGTTPILVSTDLGSRGLDIAELSAWSIIIFRPLSRRGPTAMAVPPVRTLMVRSMSLQLRMKTSRIMLNGTAIMCRRVIAPIRLKRRRPPSISMSEKRRRFPVATSLVSSSLREGLKPDRSGASPCVTIARLWQSRAPKPRDSSKTSPPNASKTPAPKSPSCRVDRDKAY